MSAEMDDLAAFVAPFTIDRVPPEQIEERSRGAAAALAARQWPDFVADALAGADPATLAVINAWRWALAMTAPHALDAADLAVVRAAGDDKLDALADWLGPVLAANLA